MANETVVTVVGNLTSDPELRFTPNGASVANFTIASTPRVFDRQAGEFKNAETLFLRCNVWRDQAENVAESLQRGVRVVAQGRLKSRSFETKEGQKRTVMELDVDDVGPSLRKATAVVTKNQPKGEGSGGQRPAQAQQSGGWGQSVQQGQGDAWAAQGGGGAGSWGNGGGEPPF